MYYRINEVCPIIKAIARVLLWNENKQICRLNEFSYRSSVALPHALSYAFWRHYAVSPCRKPLKFGQLAS